MRIMLMFAVVAIAELATFIAVESQIGLGPTLLIALATAILGSALVRRAGMSVWADFRRKLTEGGLPTRELSHGASILVAGALLISPGFLTDTIGFLLLVPAVRDQIHRIASKRLQGRVTVISSGYSSTRSTDDTIIDVEGWEVVEEEDLPTDRPQIG
jgi:UPF0716 protein FxsA